jgi:hypothetical protein
MGTALNALTTLKTMSVEAPDNTVAGSKFVNVDTNRLNHSRHLVPEQGRELLRQLPFDEVKVAVAESACDRTHENLAGSDFGN